VPVISLRELLSIQSHTELANQHSARPGKTLRSVRNAHSEPLARSIFAQLHILEQKADRSISSDSGGRRRSALRASGSSPALHQALRRLANGPAERYGDVAFHSGPAVGEPYQSVHKRHFVLQLEARVHDRPSDAVCREFC